MDKELIRMARRVWGEDAILPFKELEEFSEMVALAERERCAMLCKGLGEVMFNRGKMQAGMVANTIADYLAEGV